MIYQGTIQEVTRPGGAHKGMLDVIMLPSMRRGRARTRSHPQRHASPPRCTGAARGMHSREKTTPTETPPSPPPLQVFGNDKSDGFPEGKSADDYRKGSAVVVWVDSVQTPRPNEERYDLIILELPGIGDVYQGFVKGTPLADRMRVSVLPIPGWEGMVYRNPPHSGFPGDSGPGDYKDRQSVLVRVRWGGCHLSRGLLGGLCWRC